MPARSSGWLARTPIACSRYCLRLPGDRSEAQDAARDILLSPQPSSSAAPSSISQEQGRRQAQQRQASRPQIRRPVSSSQ
jgi:hypothetical protein